MSEDLLFTPEQMEPWRQEWQDMPEFLCEDLNPKYQILVNFTCRADFIAFMKLVGKEITMREADATRQTQSIWYPDQELDEVCDRLRYRDQNQ